MKNVILLLLVFTVVSCQSQQSDQPASRLAPDQFEKGLTGEGVQLLDVRRASEFSSGHLKNAMHADLSDHAQFTERVQFLDKNRPVYVYCLVGSRSAVAANWMRENGFTNVVELKGGINAWKNAGKEVEGQQLVKQITPEEYQASIPADRTVLVDFGAPWCPPCVKMEPVLTELKNDPSVQFELVKIDAGVHTNLMQVQQIEAIPVFIIYKNGKETWRKQGIVSKEEFIAQLK